MWKSFVFSSREEHARDSRFFRVVRNKVIRSSAVKFRTQPLMIMHAQMRKQESGKILIDCHSCFCSLSSAKFLSPLLFPNPAKVKYFLNPALCLIYAAPTASGTILIGSRLNIFQRERIVYYRVFAGEREQYTVSLDFALFLKVIWLFRGMTLFVLIFQLICETLGSKQLAMNGR